VGRAGPTPLNFGALYLPLSQGAVDGQENPLPTIQSANSRKCRRISVLTAHIPHAPLIAVTRRKGRHCRERPPRSCRVAHHAFPMAGTPKSCRRRKAGRHLFKRRA